MDEISRMEIFVIFKVDYMIFLYADVTSSYIKKDV